MFLYCCGDCPVQFLNARENTVGSLKPTDCPTSATRQSDWISFCSARSARSFAISLINVVPCSLSCRDKRRLLCPQSSAARSTVKRDHACEEAAHAAPNPEESVVGEISTGLLAWHEIRICRFQRTTTYSENETQHLRDHLLSGSASRHALGQPSDRTKLHASQRHPGAHSMSTVSGV